MSGPINILPFTVIATDPYNNQKIQTHKILANVNSPWEYFKGIFDKSKLDDDYPNVSVMSIMADFADLEGFNQMPGNIIIVNNETEEVLTLRFGLDTGNETSQSPYYYKPADFLFLVKRFEDKGKEHLLGLTLEFRVEGLEPLSLHFKGRNDFEVKVLDRLVHFNENCSIQLIGRCGNRVIGMEYIGRKNVAFFAVYVSAMAESPLGGFPLHATENPPDSLLVDKKYVQALDMTQLTNSGIRVVAMREDGFKKNFLLVDLFDLSSYTIE